MAVEFDAVVLAGGRSRRLGGVDKAALVGPDGRSALGRAVAACRGAGRMAVVGDQAGRLLPWPGVLWTREEPPFGGPARGIAAGLAVLGEAGPPWVLVLACDLPEAAAGVARLVAVAAAGVEAGSSVVGVTPDGRPQWLLGLYDRAALVTACAQLPGGGSGESVRGLVGALPLQWVTLPFAAAADLDTWTSVRALGFQRPQARQRKESVHG
ncbi:MAG: NTP transferase domain-containing protein [Propionibacteriaceae bacterium]|jgi:molybdopterin-guanine dinucleotide biosynthesis protein A|nr:NTP transferase domain-containing protein [Propionibacteriaceae bacterium]